MESVSEILTQKNYQGIKKQNFDRNDFENFKQSKFLEALFVMFVSIAAFGEWKTILNMLYGIPKAVTAGTVAVAFIYYLIHLDNKRLKKIGPAFLMYVILIGGIALWSVVIWFTSFTDSSSMTRAVEKVLFQTVSMLVAVSAVYLYGRRSIDLLLTGICIGNFGIMLVEIPNYGLGESIQSLFTCILTFGGTAEGYAECLEIHELTFLFGIFAAYYLFFAPRNSKKEIKKNIIFTALSFFFLLVGMKRIMVAAIALVSVYYFLVRKRKHKFAIVVITGIVMVAFFFVYLYVVRKGIVTYILDTLGVDMMGRDYIWSLVNSYYRLSPDFFGLGFEAVDKIVQFFYTEGILDEAYPFHNDILKVFVELGFPGFCFWAGVQYIAFPIFFAKKFNNRTAFLYMSLLLTMTVTYLTDNTAFYFWCTMGLRLIPLAYGVSCKPENENEPEKIEKWKPPKKYEMKTLIETRLYSQKAKK